MVFDLGDLEAGAEIEIKYQVKVNEGVDNGEIINSRADLSSENSSTVKRSKDVTVGSTPVIRAEIEVNDINGGKIEVGDTLEYIFTLENIGKNTAYNLNLSAQNPESLSYIKESTKVDGRTIDDENDESIFFNGLSFNEIAPEIAPGERKEIKYRAKVESAEKITVKIDYFASKNNYDPLSGSVEKTITAGVLNSQANLKFELNSSIFNDFSGWYLDIRAENGEEIYNDHKVLSAAESGQLSLPSADRNYTALIKNQDKTTFAKIEITADEISNGNLTIKTEEIDPEGIVYNSITREAVAGVVLYLLDEDGNKVDPGLLETGQQGQVTDASGSYQFIVTAEGKYQIAAEKDGYDLTPSEVLSPESTEYIRPTDITDADPSTTGVQVVDYSRPPKLNEDALYYLNFDLQTGDPDVFNNHIPIDPIQENLLKINKEASAKTTAVGEFISYQIRVENDGENDVEDFKLYDKLPNFFKYTADSALIERNGTKELFEPEGERLLSWEISELKAGESLKLSYTLVVGSGTQTGIEYLNEAYLMKANTLISDKVEAAVLVSKDPVFDLSTIIGKVYHDKNENGVQDEGEAGIAGVEIISITGEIIEVDNQGRYHFVFDPDSNTVVGETLVLKINEASLPEGAEIISQNPLIIKVRPGLMDKANFRIRLQDCND